MGDRHKRAWKAFHEGRGVRTVVGNIGGAKNGETLFSPQDEIESVVLTLTRCLDPSEDASQARLQACLRFSAFCYPQWFHPPQRKPLSHSYVYIPMVLLTSCAYSPSFQSAMGAYGYAGLVNVGKLPITVGSRTEKHTVMISEEVNFDVVLGRSWMEKMGIR